MYFGSEFQNFIESGEMVPQSTSVCVSFACFSIKG